MEANEKRGHNMGYGYDPEETTGQEHMDGTAPESGGQEYTDSAQKTDASDMSAYSGVSDDTSAYSSGSTGASDNARTHPTIRRTHSTAHRTLTRARSPRAAATNIKIITTTDTGAMIQNRNMAISQAYSRRLRPKKEILRANGLLLAHLSSSLFASALESA